MFSFCCHKPKKEDKLSKQDKAKMSKAEVVLLDCWVSPFCMRVKIALAEKGIEYEAQPEDLFAGKSELLLTSNPVYGKVPVLLHSGKPMCESNVIVNYIDETWPTPPLLPACSYDRGLARFWADFIEKKVFDAGSGIWRSKGEEQESAKKSFIEVLKTLEGALGDKEYFGGESFGFVDIVLVAMTSWFYAYEELGGFKVVEHCPKLSAWQKRCMLRDSVSKTLPEPEKVLDFVKMMKQMQGLE